MIRVLFFARLREQLGIDRDEIQLPPGIATAGDLLGHLRARGEPWTAVLAPGESLMIAVNQEMARPDTSIQDGDEVAFFPPVTGG